MLPIRFTAALLLLAAAPLISADPLGLPGAGTAPLPAVETQPAAPAPSAATTQARQDPAVPPVDAGTQPQPAPVFDDVAWQLVAFRSGDALVELKKGRRSARFELELGRMAGSAGCNRLLGSYTQNGDKLVFKPQMASSMMACPDPLMAQDQAVSAAFAATARVRREAELLELLDAAGKPVLRFVPIRPAPLVGRVWELDGLNNGKQAIVYALPGTQVTLELHDDGTLGGFDGCNRFMSGYTLEGGKLEIGPLATTRMACKGPEGAAEQAAGLAAALGAAVGYRIEGAELTLVDGQGKVAARFRTLAPPAVAPASAPAPAATTTDGAGSGPASAAPR